jgi:type III restriction enzyme
MYPYVRAASDGEADSEGNPLPPEKRLVVFPGMEVTLSLPCQAIVLFDADIPLESLAHLPGALGFTPENPDSEVAAQAQPLKLVHPNEIDERLNALEQLRGRFIVLPHVQEKGHKTLIRAGFNEHYRQCSSVGGYVDGTVPPLGTGARKILEGLDGNYGHKALGVFQTSDARRADFSNVGSPSTWVKWSRPTAEALRQSCLARQSRIRWEAPQDPAIVIKRIEVSASKFLGKLDLFVNPQYNALIGGRGTGKSTLLEYLRWALCALSAPAEEEADLLPDFEQRTRSLIEKTLAAVQGSVRVWVDVRGVSHVVDRRTNGQPEIQLKVGNGEFRTATPEEVRRLVPVEAYRQKQLSSIGGKPEDVLRFVLSSVAREASTLADRLRESADRMRLTFANMRGKEKASAEHATLNHERESLAKQREALRAQMVGLDPKDAEILAKADGYARERAIADAWQEELKSAKATLERTAATFAASPSVQKADGLPDVLVVEGIRKALRSLFEKSGSHLQDALTCLDKEAAAEAVREGDAALRTSLEKAREQFKLARERAQAHEAALKQIEVISKRIEETDARIVALGKLAEGQEAVRQQFQTAASEWAELLKNRAEMVKAQCHKIGEASHGLIRGSVSASADLSAAIAQLSDLARGTNIRSAKFDGLAERLGQAEPLSAWLTTLDELKELVGLPAEALPPACPTLRASGFNDKELRALSARMDDDSWIRLRVLTPTDVVRFEYRAREGDYIEFSDASAGQRATALMRVLLAQEDVPLLVDQPEDDLDNSVIHEVARDIWTAKVRRQILFASHNANLVVNGDADLIAFFDYAVAGEATSGEVKAQGAIDDNTIRNAITTVMEGGREAFALRRAKYNF